jgi:hypothetical protein
MRTERRFSTALVLAVGYLIGAGIVYVGLRAISGSASIAATFSLVILGFYAPVVAIIAIASARARSGRVRILSEEKRRRDVAIAACYVFSGIPFWFSMLALLRGRPALGLILFVVYVSMAAIPLQRILRLRTAFEMSRAPSSSAVGASSHPQ